MKLRWIILSGVPIGIFLYATFHGFNSQPRTVRLKESIVIDTPEGPRTSSAVIEVHVAFNDGPLERMGNAVAVGVRGEAIVVDLGNRGILFLTLSKDPKRKESLPADRLLALFPDIRTHGVEPKTIDDLKLSLAHVEMPIDALPLLVHFKNIAQPTSVERLNPRKIEDIFGPGIKVLRASIEITTEPISDKIQNTLHWLPGYYDKRLDGNINGITNAKNEIANYLSSGSFKAGADLND